MAGTSDIAEGVVKDLKRPKELKKHSEPRDVKSHAEPRDVKRHAEPRDVKRQTESKARSHSPKPVTGRNSPSNSPSKPKSDKVTITCLFNTICKTVWEKKELLDLRDKLLRQAVSGDKKKSDLATAKAFIGTCPDMCPEKERYDRQETRRLSIYEMIPGTENIPNQTPQIDHTRAVKEYSRSSADQTEPLQHELRPEHVLMTTMAYLLREIADRGEEDRWADWYDFLWNRTRGIRKDITQQQLCNRNVVELIEKCARYHIYCSHRLCEQDMMVFDSKINNENLTKCLQTLKEMYYDLEKNQLVFCPNEAEFRSYMVLMNLNEGDTLREVQELRPEVRESAEIKFALRVYSALNSHNYVRFFRMVKQATFLQACIIHRYFTQIRSKGLKVLMKALGKNNRYPLSHLKNTFSFESVQEAERYCLYYGFISKDEHVTIDSRDFMEPEVSVPPTRSISLIESKLLVPVGQIINGEKLPELTLPVPVNSFDKYGKFISKTEILKELDINVKGVQVSSAPVSKQSTFQDQRLSSSTSQQIEPLYNSNAVKGVARDLFLEVIAEYVQEIANEPIHVYKALVQTGYIIGGEILIGVQDKIVQEVCQDVLVEIQIGQQRAKEKKEREERERKEREMKEKLDKMADDVLNNFINETCSEESKDIATIEFRLVQAELYKERVGRCSETLKAELLSEVISEMVDEMSAEIYEKDVIQRLEDLHNAEKAIKLRRSSTFFQIWRTSFLAQVKLKRAMLAFPCGPSVVDSRLQIQSLLPERKTAQLFNRTMFVSQSSQITLESATDLEQRSLILTAKLSLVSLYQQLQLLKARQPLDIIRLIQPELLKIAHKPQNKEHHALWKLVLSLPDGSVSSHSSNEFSNWLNSKFKKGVIPDSCLDDYQGEILSLYNTTIRRGVGKEPLHFGVCVQSISGTLEGDAERDNRILLGCGGLLFVLPLELSTAFNQEILWSNCLQRLANLIETKPMCPSLPLVVICNSPSNEMIDIDELYEKLNITSYIQEGLVSDVHIMVVQTKGQGQVNTEDVSVTDQLSSCVQWLGKQIPETPAVNSKSLVEFVNDVILEEYFTPVLQDLHVRKQKKYLHQFPETLIHLYNSVIEYLLQIIPSPLLSDISWPIPEFTLFSHKHDQLPVYWNTVTHLQYLEQLLTDLKLPEFCYQDNQADSWEFVCQDVWSYVTMVTGSEQGASKIELISRVKQLLKHVQEDFENTCYLLEGEDNCEPTYINMPWTEIIQACIDYKLKTLNYIDPNTAHLESRKELKVYYTDKTYTEFFPPDKWKSALLDTDNDEDVTVTSTFYRAVEKSRTDKYEERYKVSDIQIIKPLSVTKDLIFSNSILDKIRVEQKDSSDFEKYLESVASEDLSTLAPDFNQSMDYDSNAELNESVMDKKIREYYEDILHNGTISERLSTLQEKMESDRVASQLFEQKLEYLLNS